jgi:hypothetical protein
MRLRLPAAARGYVGRSTGGDRSIYVQDPGEVWDYLARGRAVAGPETSTRSPDP